MTVNAAIFFVCLLAFDALAAAGAERGRLDPKGFRELMQRVERGWSTQNTDLALSSFAEDAVYMEPPDLQLYRGHAELRPYFGALTPGYFMRFHRLFFDEASQSGGGEYSFGVEGEKTADHGAVVVELRGGKIAFWREYQRKGPMPFEAFAAADGKGWQWTIKNYPAPAGTPPLRTFAVEFRTGPSWETEKPAQEQKHFADHSANLRKLRGDGRIVVGGRYGDVGLVLLRATSENEARALVADAAVRDGVFVVAVSPWRTFMNGSVEGAP
jgi:SnoaL-like domain